MITNAEIKFVRSLKEKKFRDQSGLFVVEGEKMVQEALSSNFKVEQVWRVEEIGEETMKRISALTSPSPVLAVVRKPEPEGLVLQKGLYLALDSLRDPGNVGTIIRIADWFGVSTVFASRDSVDIYNPKVIQSSMGSIFRVRFVYSDIPQLCARFKEKGMKVYGTFLDGENIYNKGIAPEGLVVMGNEANGISPQTAAQVNSRLYIPSYGNSGAESLNVAVATAVTLAEFRRR